MLQTVRVMKFTDLMLEPKVQLEGIGEIQMQILPWEFMIYQIRICGNPLILKIGYLMDPMIVY